MEWCRRDPSLTCSARPTANWQTPESQGAQSRCFDTWQRPGRCSSYPPAAFVYYPLTVFLGKRLIDRRQNIQYKFRWAAYAGARGGTHKGPVDPNGLRQHGIPQLIITYYPKKVLKEKRR